VKPLEQVLLLLGIDADSAVLDLQFDAGDGVINPSEADDDRARERELERVGQQVQHDLGPHLGVDVDGFAQLGAVDLEA
jgi:hypothetical protein